MTTVDVRVRNESAGEVWAFHNGLTGPASRLSAAIFDELVGGRVEAIGAFNCAQYRARLSGRQLSGIIANLDLSGWLYRSSSDPEVMATMIDPDDFYIVDVIEF